MKRLFSMIIVLSLCVCFAGCKALDYSKASRCYKNAEYARAMELYASLGDYADSAAMAHLSWQKADYEAAAAAYAAGDYRQAMTLYYGLEMYMDSPVKAIESQYRLGLALIQAGEYEEAIDLLQPLGTYEDSAYRVNIAVDLWLRQILGETGGVTMVLDEAEQEKLLMVTTGGKTVDVIYTRQHQLLGLPNTSRFVLTIYPQTQTVSYTASNLSTAASTILEEASGMVDPAIFGNGQGLDTYTFTQTITEADGTVTVSTDTTQAISLYTLLPEAAAVISEHLAALLAQTGTDITPGDLGFFSIG